MKPATKLTAFSTLLLSVNAITLDVQASGGGYVQRPAGAASFTSYSGCGTPSCGKAASGFTAAINQLAFGSAPGLGAGDACGRCFTLTANQDPYTASFSGPFKTIVVKVTDLCPTAGNAVWCGQTTSVPTNQFHMPVHFDICSDTGGASAFFPSGHGALTGSYQEVPCSEWVGSDESTLWQGGCLEGDTAGIWPAIGCGNKGSAPA